MEWLQLAYDMENWWVVANMVINFRVWEMWEMS